MADVSKIKLPDNSELDIKDSRLPSVSSSDNGKILKVVSGEWSIATESGGGVIDSALSAVSENPVQNKVIYAAIGDIETLLSAL